MRECCIVSSKVGAGMLDLIGQLNLDKKTSTTCAPCGRSGKYGDWTQEGGVGGVTGAAEFLASADKMRKGKNVHTVYHDSCCMPHLMECTALISHLPPPSCCMHSRMGRDVPYSIHSG